MVKDVSYEGIGVQAATFKVDATTITKLKASFLDAATQKVDINGKNLAVKLSADNTVGFGAASPTTADAFFGVILTYEEDGYAAVQYAGFVEGVETTGAVGLGVKTLAVNDAGKVASVSSTDGHGMVTKAATADDKTANILIG